MTLDEAVALSLVDNLPRPGLTARLQADDPELLEIAGGFSAAARAARQKAAAAGIGVVAWHQPPFPTSLLATADCPPALWFRGGLAALQAPCIAVVGSRGASAAGLDIAARLGRDLAARGVTIVSGLARGVDSAAHRGALESGRTVAVLGSGVDRVYPAEHRELAQAVSVDGLVASEFPPGTLPMPFRFPMRNRIISGLSRAVIVIEASEQSGSLITAACALEQGREVMAVPGSVAGGRNRGGHALIRDGATIVETAADVLGELGLGGAPFAATAAGTSAPSDSCADPVLRHMRDGEAYDLDALAAASGLGSARLLPHLLELELAGKVRRAGAGRFLRQ